eukprot:Plantae.Rhodophyta-Hildenbrandia_rubra.ctg10721.p2 GENE.Plantae.Rhodophyta-Hildenbrandia_rubra.ctg10721~~Plantae.Rhodophyta-Hildenbrandia_rubra.ctg10721.p2  ORF type:complete len:336 (-),score=58.73 Plantae.Rhodophyta-Hildenbrandia_rubra.ctg10721:1604-2611(-)
MDARLIRSEPPRARVRHLWDSSEPSESQSDVPVVDLTDNDEPYVQEARNLFPESALRAATMVRGRGVKYMMKSAGLSVLRRKVLAERERRLMRANAEWDEQNRSLRKGNSGDSAEESVVEIDQGFGNERFVDVHAVGEGHRHVWRAWAMVGYAHAAIAVAIAAVVVWCLVMFAWGMRADVARKFRGRVDVAEEKVRQCQDMWRNNGCDVLDVNGHKVMPALRDMCKTWDRCIQGARWVWMEGYSASIWAEVVAETVNAFAGKISSSSVMVTLILGGLIATLLSIASWGVMHKRIADASSSQDITSAPNQYQSSPIRTSPRIIRRLSFSEKSPRRS